MLILSTLSELESSLTALSRDSFRSLAYSLLSPPPSIWRGTGRAARGYPESSSGLALHSWTPSHSTSP